MITANIPRTGRNAETQSLAALPSVANFAELGTIFTDGATIGANSTWSNPTNPRRTLSRKYPSFSQSPTLTTTQRITKLPTSGYAPSASAATSDTTESARTSAKNEPRDRPCYHLNMRTQRRRRKHPKRRGGTKRPGATLKRNHWWAERRREEEPEVLAAVDWMLFRRQENPFRAKSYRHKRYQRAYTTAKAETPDPGFPRLTQVGQVHGKPPKIHQIHYKQVTVESPRKCPLWTPPPLNVNTPSE